MATVTDYNPLMKDFPINDLLAATELERIRTSVQTIFTHLRKIRNTKYPIQRALRLVEAISRDLVNQMLKVLNTRRLMFISFEEFEKVMLLCVDVFATWDDEYDRLQVCSTGGLFNCISTLCPSHRSEGSVQILFKNEL